MTVVRANEDSGSPALPERVKVWDPFVRIFHWSLVALFATALMTPDLSEMVHQGAGYAIGALVGARIVWGFAGPAHARFRDFIYSPREVASFLADTALLRARRYIGHNPAGGAMVLALLVSVATTCVTGHMMTLESFWGVKWLEEVHEFVAWSCVGLIVLHVLGVIFASLEHRENLVLSMITGWKRR